LRAVAVVAGVTLFVSLAGVAVGLSVWKGRQMAAAAAQVQPEMPEAVNIVEVKTARWRPTSDLVGTVFARRSVTVQNELPGVVRFVGFESGSIVEAGQVLVKLDDRTDQAQLKSAEAALRVAEADVSVVETRIKLAEAEFKRQEQAVASRATPAVEVDRARAEMEKTAAERIRAQATVDEERSKVEEVRTRIEKLTITAPFRARVGLRTIHEGQFLAQQMGMESTPIATLQEMTDTIFIDFAIPQEYLDRVRIGTVVVGTRDTGGTGGTGGSSGGNVELKVVAIDSTASLSTRNVRVRAEVDNRDDALRPGMFVKIRVPVEEARDYVVVPVTAVRRASYADQVFVIKEVQEPGPDGVTKPAMRASQRFVKLGPTIGDEVIVLEGLNAGDRIATSGSFKLREGALVMPGGAGGPGGPGGSPPAAGAADSGAPAPTEKKDGANPPAAPVAGASGQK